MSTPAFARVHDESKHFETSKEAYRWMLNRLNTLYANCADEALEKEKKYQISNMNKFKSIQSIAIKAGMDGRDWDFIPDTSSDDLQNLKQNQKKGDDLLNSF